ncbi:hypothetical protein JF66_10210 [Cryobacterium sp. MLB-32]|uniref:sensor histidine kinase n=1 Tax=Cryobacterium sp. MLB-32 TaxID=1529318 RepID=UPI0004E60780|nr:HAMP domain-containing sensor histidine kinase [Cryobacterium sp. MLB-32]KFF59595.1 hypothetical protein JF66_10210 [Cryobacterium sp. MLB-32]
MIQSHRRTLRGRLALTLGCVMAVVIVAFTAAVYALMSHELHRLQDLSVQQEAIRVARLVEAQTDWTASGYCDVGGGPACTRIISATDAPDDSPLELPVNGAALGVAAGTEADFYQDATVNGVGVRMLVTAISGDRAVLTGTATRSVDVAVERLRLLLGGFGVLGVSAAAIAAYVGARRGLRPIRQLAAAADQIATTRNPSHRIPVPGTEELAGLAATINVMLGELEVSQTAQKQLVVDASHELRTPLTSLHTNFTLLQRDDLPAGVRTELQNSVRREIVGMTQLVNDLTELARSEQPMPASEVELGELVEYCVSEARRHWPERGFESRIDDSVLWMVPGNAAQLARLVTNLLDNAAKFSSSGDTISAQLSRVGPEIELSIADSGPGFNPEEIELVFSRFYRAPSARALPGSGLGLAIAHQICSEHGGSILARNTPPGATVTVRLPARDTTFLMFSS